MKIKSLTDLPSVRVYLNRIGAEVRSLRVAVVRQNHGAYWKDIAIIRFSKDGVIEASNEDFAPTDSERLRIQSEMTVIEWPQLKKLKTPINLPDEIAKANPADVFEFRDINGDIIMLQLRRAKKGDKSYVPYTYWDDDVWRLSEPEGELPLYNEHRLKDASVVFIHEGAKAARYCQWMVDSETPDARAALERHPWGNELKTGVHVGWIGGALSPYRTGWSIINRIGIQHAYIVADNDAPGLQAVPAISQQLRCPTFCVRFTDDWPASFDLADSFPKNMYSSDTSFYVGPAFRECLQPATWATDLIQMAAKGRPANVLRDSFRAMWAYAEDADLFICKMLPEWHRSEALFNKTVAPFSHTLETSKLVVKAYEGRAVGVCYRPDAKGFIVSSDEGSQINLHVPSPIKAIGGDPEPWLAFLRYLIVRDYERSVVERWCATLIARPDIRMGYGLLLVSERQGTGKTTLGAHILAPLVGKRNTGWPSDMDIKSPFNDWIAHKRLVVMNEIYSGNSWKAYHSLKSVITDHDVMVNQKYQRNYRVENWAHVFASSNSRRCLKMESTDRRWFYPEVTEEPWSMEKFGALRKWIDAGGLNIIRHWAEKYGDYVKPGEVAPMTEQKRFMIEGSLSEAQREAVAIAENIVERQEPVALTMKDIVGWCRANVQGTVYDSDYELRRSMTDNGLFAWPTRVKVNGRMDYVLYNKSLEDELSQSGDDNKLAVLRQNVKRCTELMETRM